MPRYGAARRRSKTLNNTQIAQIGRRKMGAKGYAPGAIGCVAFQLASAIALSSIGSLTCGERQRFENERAR
jgi:hypothetical protein